jgi:hypothetical protein
MCTTGIFGTGQLVACLILLGIVIQALRPNPNTVQD